MPLPPMTEDDLREEAFDQATKSAVCDAFNETWLLMQAWGDPFANVKRYPTVRTLLARRIINAARMGERDVTRLSAEGLRYIRSEFAQQWPKDNP
jgi:hypothetical protein